MLPRRGRPVHDHQVGQNARNFLLSFAFSPQAQWKEDSQTPNQNRAKLLYDIFF